MNTTLRRQPDFEQFLRVVTRSQRPTHLPFYEHLASPGFIAEATGTKFDQMSPDEDGFWNIYVNFWLDMGYDCIPMEIPLNCPLPDEHEGASEGSEWRQCITSRQDYEEYPWPSLDNPINFYHFDTVEKLLPEGCKIVGGVCGGPYEWVSQMMGTVGLSYALADQLDLVEDMFSRIGSLHISAVRQLATHSALGALRQGDDLGFKTATFLNPRYLRKYIFPIYKQMAELSHQQGKPFVLHSCGNLEKVYEDLIEDCRIDAKHSFEDTILPVAEFKKMYGKRITPLGGLDVDVICRGTEDEIRSYTRKHVEECFSDDGFWALGTGNSLTDYMPVQHYIWALDEARKVA